MLGPKPLPKGARIDGQFGGFEPIAEAFPDWGLPLDELHRRVTSGSLLRDVRAILETGAGERLSWLRTNVSRAMEIQGHAITDICAMTGLSVGTVKGLLGDTDSSIKNVLLIALSLGLSLAELEQPPAQFEAWFAARPGHAVPGTGAA